MATTKRALSKLCAERGSQLNWDLQLPWVMLGYNASTQAATGFSPYQLMHAVTPTVPPAVRERLLQPADWDGSAAAAADFLARSKLVKERCVMAGDNLRIAQHRDTLRYAKLRSGCYTPQLRRYLVGDLVYVKRKGKEGLDVLARQLILRVSEVRPSGVLILQGRCGTKRAVHSGQCAPCHLPDVELQVDYSLGKPPAAALCESCGGDDSDQLGQLIFCDNCNAGWHLACHQPRLSSKPRGTWVCQGCALQGITLDTVKAMQQEADQQAARQQRQEKLSPAELKARDLDGRLLLKLFTKPGQGKRTQWYWGKVHFREGSKGSNLLIVYEDGDAEVTTLRRLQGGSVKWQPEDTVPPAGVLFKLPALAEAEIQERTQLTVNRDPAKQQTSHSSRQSAVPEIQPAPAQPCLRRSTRQVAAPQAHSKAASSQLLSPVLTAAACSAAAGVLPAGTPATANTGTVCLVADKQEPASLPSRWDLTQPGGVQAAMQLLMPGPLHSKDATRISNVIRAAIGNSNSDRPQPRHGFVPMDPAEVQPLLNSVDFSGCNSVFDPYAGSGTVSRVFAQAGYTVRSNDINPLWGHCSQADALQPGSYMPVSQVIVTSPPFDLLDLAAPLAAAQAGMAACVHVPGHWISNPRPARQQWLQQLAVQNRLHIIMGLPRGPSNRRCAWVIVASSANKLALLLRHPLPTVLPYSYAGF